MAYELPPLPYDYAALEPYIDAETMKLHHDKHHQTYINNANGAFEKHPELAQKSADELLRDLNAIPEDVRGVLRNNAGGHSNHSIFWHLMAPQGPGVGGAPTGEIADQIKADFGDFDTFKKPSTRPRPSNSAPAGAGWSSRAASSRSLPPPIRTHRSRRASTPSSATMCGSTPTT